MKKSNKMTFIFLAPTIVILLLLTVYPFFFYALFISFRKINLIKGTNVFIGFQNYINLFQDRMFFVSIMNTVIFVLVAVLFFEFLLGMIFFALFFFNTGIKALKFFRSVVLLPMLLPPITVALTWKMMFAYDTGILNYLLEKK